MPRRSGPASTSGPSTRSRVRHAASSTWSTTRRSGRPRTGRRWSRAGAGSGDYFDGIGREPAGGGRRRQGRGRQAGRADARHPARPRGAAGRATGSSPAPASGALEDWSEADRERFREAAPRGRSGTIAVPGLPALPRDARAGHPAAAHDPTDQPGLVHLPGGAEAYRTAIRVHTTLDLSPEEIHATGLAEIERIDAEFVELGGRVLGTTDLPSTLAALRDDPRLRFATADEVFETAKRSLARATVGDDRLVRPRSRAPPASSCRCRATPRSTRRSRTTRGRRSTARRPGRYYINLHAPETRPRYEAEALAFHEAVPGHHLQIAVAQELDGLPAFQRMLGSTAFAEGWGLYTERLSDEMGLYIVATWTGSGSCRTTPGGPGRLVVDTGMHALGWTRQQAIDFLAGAHGPRREQHRQRGRSVHRLAGPGAGLQDRPAGDPAAPRRGAGAARRRVRHQGLPRHRARRRGDQPPGAPRLVADWLAEAIADELAWRTRPRGPLRGGGSPRRGSDVDRGQRVEQPLELVRPNLERPDIRRRRSPSPSAAAARQRDLAEEAASGHRSNGPAAAARRERSRRRSRRTRRLPRPRASARRRP